MTQRDPALAVRDSLAEIAVLAEIAQRMTFETFRDDSVGRRAAAYAVQTISEAVRRIPEPWLAEHPAQPWAQIKSIGNRIRHEYYRIDDAILWKIVTVDAPALKLVMEAMLEKHGRLDAGQAS